MAINLLESLKESFQNVDSLTLEKVEKMVLDTNAYFESLETALQSGNEMSREEALKQALEIKEFLDEKLSELMIPNLETLPREERELVLVMMDGLKLGKSHNNKPKIKKIKPIKLS